MVKIQERGLTACGKPLISFVEEAPFGFNMILMISIQGQPGCFVEKD